MKGMEVINILDLGKAIGEDNLKVLLSDFSSPQNPDMEDFIKNNAYEFAKKKISISYLIINADNELLGVFSLTHKAIKIINPKLSNNSMKKFLRYAYPTAEEGYYYTSAFLIAQLGKNFSNLSDELSGRQLINLALNILRQIQYNIGGGIVYLECENHKKLLEFYGKNGFVKFGERYSEKENTRYIQLFTIL